ncbi:DoxX family protein [Parapedobacter tibetensis]|uniref:DoxX family protein n=1 Tax=Parapedobacter tibetensis TaxID=2972951 RepID=UPI00214DBB43|nr:DoxX family protein [Parapedobacter tibetensis]
MASEQKTSKTMNIILWIAQVMLSIGFIWAASMKLFQPADKLAEMWAWTAGNVTLVKLTGVLDLLAGIGLVFPALLHIQPKLTIYAAFGTIALMIAASIFHISRGEASQIGINIFFGIIAVFIIWGRLKKVPLVTKAK